MTTGRQLERLIRQADRELQRLERRAIASLSGGLRLAYLELDDRLRRIYNAALDDIQAVDGLPLPLVQARARAVATQVRALLDLPAMMPAQPTLGDLIFTAYDIGARDAGKTMAAYGVNVDEFASVPIDVAARATRTAPRLIEIGQARVEAGREALRQHGIDAAQKIERHIISGIAQGRGYRLTAGEIAREVDILMHEAERIVRTESIAASDEARRDKLKEFGVEYVQIIVTMDERLCGYCASRAGNVYRIDEAQLPYHPNCRCYASAWKPEWQRDGLIDTEWMKAHRKESLERTEDPIRTGPSPSEKWRGLDKAPTPVWTP